MPDLSQYATQAQLALYGGLHASVLGSITGTDQDAYLQAATKIVKSYLAARASGTIEAVGLDVVVATCKLAGWSILTDKVGFNPSTVGHQALSLDVDRTRSWLKDVAAGRAVAEFTDDTPDVTEGTAEVYTEPMRGWGDELP